MDPDEVLRKLLAAVEAFSAAKDNDTAAYHGDDVVSAVKDLDEWLSRGGFLPARWSRAQRPDAQ